MLDEDSQTANYIHVFYCIKNFFIKFNFKLTNIAEVRNYEIWQILGVWVRIFRKFGQISKVTEVWARVSEFDQKGETFRQSQNSFARNITSN